LKTVLRVSTTRILLMLAITWTALVIFPGQSEPIKLAGLAFVATLLIWRGWALSWAASAVLSGTAVVAVVVGLLALEPNVAFLGSLARAQGVLAILAVTALAGAATSLDAQQRLGVYRLVALLGGLVAVYALLQFVGLDPVAWVGVADSRPAATLSNPTTLAGWLVLLLPISAALALTDAARRRWWLGLLVLQFLALLTTGSRSAVLALLGVGTVLGLLLDARHWHRGVVVLVCALGLGVLLAALRPASLHDRAELWQAAAHTLVHAPQIVDLHGQSDTLTGLRPWLGYGPDQQRPALAAARTQSSFGRPESQSWDADRAHQWLLDRALEMGLAGILAGLLLTGLVVRACLRSWRSTDIDIRLEAYALAIALGAWLLHLQASFALTGDRTLAWVWIGFALALGREAGGQLSATAAPQSAKQLWLSRLLRSVSAVVLLSGALAAIGLLPSALLAQWAPALTAEQRYVAGQNHYLRALSSAEPAAAAQAMTDSAQAFEQALALRRFDRDAAFGAASAWAEAAAAGASPSPLPRAQHWVDRLSAIAADDPRLPPIRSRIAEVASRTSSD